MCSDGYYGRNHNTDTDWKARAETLKDALAKLHGEFLSYKARQGKRMEAVWEFTAICEGIDERIVMGGGPCGYPGAFFDEMTDTEAAKLYSLAVAIKKGGGE